MITDIDDYFAKGCGRCRKFGTPDCSSQLWGPGLAELREICRAVGLTETAKWGHPCYTHNDRNIAIIGAFRSNFRISFFNAALMTDPHQVLEKQGPNTQSAGVIRFTDNARVAKMGPVIAAYLAEAIGYADAGLLSPKVVRDVVLPDELIEALDGDPELAEAFHGLTPGRQKSYVINLNGVKASATRVNRIAKFRDKILSGKGATER